MRILRIVYRKVILIFIPLVAIVSTLCAVFIEVPSAYAASSELVFTNYVGYGSNISYATDGNINDYATFSGTYNGTSSNVQFRVTPGDDVRIYLGTSNSPVADFTSKGVLVSSIPMTSPGWNDLGVVPASADTVTLFSNSGGVLEVADTSFSAPSVVPSSLSATPGNRSASLSWAGSANDLTYNVYENGARIATGISATGYTVTGLTNGTSYKFSISGVNQSGSESAQSNVVSVTPVTPIIDVPTGLSASAGHAQVSLSWTSGSNDSTFNIYRNGKEIKNGLTYAGFLDTGLTNGTSYNYQVQGVGPYGTLSKLSLSVSATPQAIAMGSITNAKIDKNGSATWTPPPNAPIPTKYSIFQNGSLVGTTNGLTFKIPNFDSNARYSITATATGYSESISVFAGAGIAASSMGANPNDFLKILFMIFGSLGGFVLLGIAIWIAPRLIDLIRESNFEPSVFFHRYRSRKEADEFDRDLGYERESIRETEYTNESSDPVPERDVVSSSVTSDVYRSPISRSSSDINLD